MAAAARPELREREDPAERLEPADKPCGSHIRCVDKSASLSIFMHLYVKCTCARMPTTPKHRADMPRRGGRLVPPTGLARRLRHTCSRVLPAALW